MRSLRELVARVARGDVPVTFVGETGVGKDLLARRLHAASARAKAPFVRVSCVGLSEAALEGELRNGERNALDAAREGTLFLDDVAELSVAAQSKLLRLLQSGDGRPPSAAPTPLDIRFVSATSRDIEGMLAAGEFRADLFHRLCGIVIRVPPLRERHDEIDTVAMELLEEVSRRRGRPVPAPSADFMTSLRRYAWPGNVRELAHALEFALLQASANQLEAHHLPQRVLCRSNGAKHRESLKAELDQIERVRIAEALDKCAGNQSRAARLLGMPRRTLIERIESYGLPRPRAKRRLG